VYAGGVGAQVEGSGLQAPGSGLWAWKCRRHSAYGHDGEGPQEPADLSHYPCRGSWAQVSSESCSPLIGRHCGVYEDLTSAISLGFIAWLDLGLAVSLQHDVLVVLAAGVLHQLRVRLEYEGDRECPRANIAGRTIVRSSGTIGAISRPRSRRSRPGSRRRRSSN
jgi:hypothetical protein